MIKIFQIGLVSLIFLFTATSSVYSACWYYLNPPEAGGPVCGYAPNDTCDNYAPTGGSYGKVYYSQASYGECDNTDDPYDDTQGYYWHTFNCDVPCGSGTPADSGGSNCPVECRANACGAGYTNAAGCPGTGPNFGCAANQACCRPNSCSGPPSQSCNTTCTDECKKEGNCGGGTEGDFCGYDTSGNPKYECHQCTTVCTTPSPPPSAPPCSITSPTITAVNRSTATSATITWTPGTVQSGSVQRIFISQNPNQVNASCALPSSPGCVVNQQSLPNTQSSYATGNVLSAGSVYYIRIVNYSTPSCSRDSNSTNSMYTNNPLPYLSSCSLSPTSVQLQITETAVITSSVDSSSEINRVEFSSSNTSAITATSPDYSSPYTSLITAIGSGNANITSSVYFDDGHIACTNVAGGNGTLSGGGPDGYPGDDGGGTTTPGGGTDTDGGGGNGDDGETPIIVNNLSSAWWQIKDSDITSNGTLNSSVPAGLYFGLQGLGGYAGVPTYTTTTNITQSNSSVDQWITQNTNKSMPVFDYSYFSNQIPDDVVFNNISSPSISISDLASGGTATHGYYWYKYDGSTSGVDLHITSGSSLGSRKVILLVDSANVFFDSNVNLTDGLGFFMTVADRNIYVDPTVGGGGAPHLEGFFIADETFNTGAGTNQLHVRGAIVSYGGIVMNRDLGASNLTTASELFEYAPDQSILFPAKLATRKVSWKEVAP